MSVSKVVKRVAVALRIGKTSFRKQTREKCPRNINLPATSVHSGQASLGKEFSLKQILSNQNPRRHNIYQYYKRKEYPTMKALLTTFKGKDLFVGHKTSLSFLILIKLGLDGKALR